MNIETKLLKGDEKVIFELRSLYEKYGYSQYKMSKFEEYDLYVRNKDFLVSDNIITFTDTNGKLMALKPDVTLSIIKNSKDIPEITQKVYYDENVYRISKNTDSFKEILQVGLECVGNVDDWCIYEVLTLAAESLSVISDDYVLDVSHMGIIKDLVQKLDLSIDGEKEILKALGEKNTHQIKAICEENDCSNDLSAKICELANLYEKANEVMPRIKELASDFAPDSIAQLEKLTSVLSDSGYGDRIHIDFSVVNDMGYYNGIVFTGFVNGVPEGVLSGGQYDKLLKKMNRKSKAIGFAVYPDTLERLMTENFEYDIDTVILYSENTDLKTLSDAVKMMTSSGKSVTAQREVPAKLRYRQLLKMNDKGVEIIENNA
ncbi:MAG: ATP phosphoribosyltransferase regulatory subunit [Clostridia bacterium]|nr:ATP phosphoribosyltransferase regulatory subunit [Clostridia bacterium]